MRLYYAWLEVVVRWRELADGWELPGVQIGEKMCVIVSHYGTYVKFCAFLNRFLVKLLIVNAGNNMHLRLEEYLQKLSCRLSQKSAYCAESIFLVCFSSLCR